MVSHPMDKRALRLPDPTVSPTDRHTAAVMHVSSIFFLIIGPVLGYFVAGAKSPFVKSHSAQALIDLLVFKLIWGIFFIASLVHTIMTAVELYHTGGESFDWRVLVGKILLTLGVVGLLWLINLILSLVQMKNASRGIWPRGRIARKVAERARLKLDSDLPR